MNRIKILQIIFFLIFLVFMISPFLMPKFSNITFMNLDIFSYIFSFKFNFLFIILLFLLLIEIFYGRIFCAFICPMGNIITFFDSVFKKYRKKELKFNRNYTFLPAILIIIFLVFKFFGFNLIGYLDPLSIITRFFNSVLKFRFAKILGIEILFIILFSLIGRRVWCKYLCPLGFVHRIISINPKYTRIVEKCINCKKCFELCPMDAISNNNFLKYDKSLCILCYKCVELCPGKTEFKFNFKNKLDKSRREFIKIMPLFFLFNFKLMSGKKVSKKSLLRPPGATNESIYNNCLRCLECVKVCPTNVLQPGKITEGIENIYTPVFKAGYSYCEYECNLCTQICPTEAIKRLDLNSKKRWKIGIAKVFRNLCVVWSLGVDCLVCEEHCPVPEKAIKIVEIKKNGRIVKAPVVDSSLCIGCAICQNKCPVEGSAIKVLEIKHGKRGVN